MTVILQLVLTLILKYIVIVKNLFSWDYVQENLIIDWTNTYTITSYHITCITAILYITYIILTLHNWNDLLIGSIFRTFYNILIKSPVITSYAPPNIWQNPITGHKLMISQWNTSGKILTAFFIFISISVYIRNAKLSDWLI